MNVLAHALASLYGLYDIDDPEGSPGLKPLIDRMFGDRIGVAWDRYLYNFDLQPDGAAEHLRLLRRRVEHMRWTWRGWAGCGATGDSGTASS